MFALALFALTLLCVSYDIAMHMPLLIACMVISTANCIVYGLLDHISCACIYRMRNHPSYTQCTYTQCTYIHKDGCIQDGCTYSHCTYSYCTYIYCTYTQLLEASTVYTAHGSYGHTTHYSAQCTYRTLATASTQLARRYVCTHGNTDIAHITDFVCAGL